MHYSLSESEVTTALKAGVIASLQLCNELRCGMTEEGNQ